MFIILYKIQFEAKYNVPASILKLFFQINKFLVLVALFFQKVELFNYMKVFPIELNIYCIIKNYKPYELTKIALP